MDSLQNLTILLLLLFYYYYYYYYYYYNATTNTCRISGHTGSARPQTTLQRQASQIQNTAEAHQIALGVNVGCLPSKTHTCLPFRRELVRQAGRSIHVR